MSPQIKTSNRQTHVTNAVLTERFSALYPGAYSNNTLPANPRVFQQRAQGARFWDIEGKEYIDYTGASGPNILGHCHSEYTAALQAFMQNHSVCTGSSYLFGEADIQLGEKIITHVPCAEQVKLCVSGSEAVQQAIRLARAYTQRPYYLKFSGHYHGWIDNIYGGEVDPAPVDKPFPLYKQSIAGQSAASQHEGLMIPWGDIDCLEQTLQAYGDEIAIVMMETVCISGSLPPPPGYLQAARALCDRYHVLLCFDEVITGFRVGLGGAQGLYGVTPDLCTLGKALGGGMPISAVAGRQELLEQFRDQRVMGPGTFNGNPLCIQAALTTLTILERDNGAAYQQMAQVQQQLMNGMDSIASELGIPVRVQGPTGVFGTFIGFDPEQPLSTLKDLVNTDYGLAARFHQAIWDEGVGVLCGRWFPSVVHSLDDVGQTLEAYRRALKKL